MSQQSAGTAQQAPTSPHLQVWRWTVTLFVSITHRMTGMALYSGTILLTVWLAAAATGPEAFAAVQGIYTSPLGLIIMAGYSWALFFHLLNGIRHLAWDAGYGFSIPAAKGTAWGVVAGSLILTIAIWGIALLTGGN